MSLLPSNLRSLTILLLIELALLQIQVAGFTIGKADTVIKSQNSDDVGTRTVKDWDGNTKPPGHGKLDELEYNEIPIKENSSKSVQGISGTTTQKPSTVTRATAFNSSSTIDAVITANTLTEGNDSSTATVSAITTANVTEEQTDDKSANTTTNKPENDNFNRSEILKSNAKEQNESYISTKSDNITESTTQLLLSVSTIANSKNVSTNTTQNRTLSSNNLKSENISTSVVKINNDTDNKSENRTTATTQLENESISKAKPENVTPNTNQRQNILKSDTEQESVTENSSQLQNESVSFENPPNNISVLKLENESPNVVSNLQNDNAVDVKPENLTPNNSYIQNDATDSVNNENVTAFNSVSQNVSVTTLKDELMGTATTPLNNVAVIAMQTDKVAEYIIQHDTASVIPIRPEEKFSIANQYQSTTITINQDQTETPIVMLTEYVDSTNANNSKLNHETNIENVVPMAVPDNTSYSSKSVEIGETNATDMLLNIESDNKIQNVSSDTSTEALKMASKEAMITKEFNSQKENESKKDLLQNELAGINDNDNGGSKGANTSLPHWKKYTEIERKRVNTVINNTKPESGEILVGASSAQGRSGLSLEKALSGASDISSLQQLKNDLLASNLTTTKASITQTAMPEITTTADSPRSQAGQDRTVSSLRAGYLDNSARSNTSAISTLKVERKKLPDVSTTSTMPTSATITNEKSDRFPVTYTSRIQTTSTTREMDSGNNEVPTSSKAPDLTTYNIEEELLQAEILSNSRDLEQQKKKRLNKLAENATRRYDTSVEDELAVQPISNERPRGAGRYTVSPNYKPLKKIEVQPSKPFVRHPDDNSWRNESLSSLGIVFKANNSSKPLTQVLKNKTETVLNTIVENYNKEQPELKQRLEKIAEKRKSKKKINQFGETVYTDYEESSGEGQKSSEVSTRPSIVTSTTTRPQKVINESPLKTVTRKTKTKFDFNQKLSASIDDYDNDDDEVDYSFPNIDLKKSNASGSSGVTQQPTPDANQLLQEEFAHTPPPPRPSFPERKPTVQYFPPREKTTTVAANDYDTDFQKLVDAYTLNVPAKQGVTEPSVTAPTFQLPDSPRQVSPKAPETTPQSVSTIPPEPQRVYTVPNHDGQYERNSYVIKNFRDFLDEVLNSDEHLASRVAEEPLLAPQPQLAPRGGPPKEFYDYQDQFRKDIMSRFAENFDNNSHRFRANFPVVYNTSVVHSGVGGQAAESMAFVKRLYENAKGFQLAGANQEPCDRTVELSPAYELHYYVPEQEETEDKIVRDIYQVRL